MGSPQTILRGVNDDDESVGKKPNDVHSIDLEMVLRSLPLNSLEIVTWCRGPGFENWKRGTAAKGWHAVVPSLFASCQ